MSRRRIFPVAAAALSAALWAYACGDSATEPPTPPPHPPRPATVAVMPAAVQLTALGATVQLTAEVRDQNGQAMAGAAVTWASSAAAVATVSTSGLVTAVANGSATITATSGAASGNATVTVAGENPDRAALVALYDATDGPNWANNEGWLTDAPLGEWYGVSTDASGRVWQLNLGGDWDRERREWIRHGLSGAIPPELGELTNLRTLALYANELTGPIPPELGNLARLETLDIGHNRLRGPIPPELGKLASLSRLRLGPNSLSGPIPPELGNLASLSTLNFNNNDLSGPIPPELGGLTELTYLSLGRNDGLSGAIPPELGELTNLRTLALSVNELTGPIPPELGNLARLETLDIGHNRLRGPIPPELGKLASLLRLRLDGNSLSGLIPPELGSLANLTVLSVFGNDLSGPIPPELGGLVNLSGLFLASNNLSGAIPRSLLGLTSLKSLNLYRAGDLCAPGTPEFRDWLEGMDHQDATYCSESDRAVLELLHEATAGGGWTDSEGWLGGSILSKWHGISADSLGRVEALDLGGNGLSGRLPSNLGELDQMTELTVADNPDLTGRLPSSLTRLPLGMLDYAGTGLCAPGEASVRAWLGTIPSHRGTGVECAPLSDRAILEAFYHDTDGPNWRNNENWLTDAPVGEWYGVDTDASGRVVRIDLAAGWDTSAQARIRHGLNGPISPELSAMANLAQLVLVGNELTGPIPPELGGMANLRELDLGDNELTGPIPAQLGGLPNLTHLNLRWNSLSGPIPPELGGMTSLRELDLTANELRGSIPPELGNLANLRELDLTANELSGSIPPELGGMTSLRELDLRNNELRGSIPPELGNLTSLRELDFRNNELRGSIPREIGNLANLAQLRLSINELTGSIPPELGSLSSLSYLLLGDNSLTGPIPPELGNLGRLEVLLLGNNSLTGPLPPQLGGLAALREFVLVVNPDLSGTLPATLTALGNLELFSTGGTMLCAPSDAAFLRWLEAIPSRRVARCAARAAMAYMVQAVQSREFPVPLVAGREALLRVFPTAARANREPMPAVRARLYVDGREARVEHIPGRPGSIPTEVDEGSLSKSVNAVISGHLVRPGLEMVIEVDPDGMLDPELGVVRRIPETGRLPVDVRAMPVLDLTLVPFLWTTRPDSAVLDSTAVMATDPEGAELLWGVRTLLPVGDLEVTAHEPVWSSSNNAADLLRRTEAIRVMEGGTGHYMGVLTGGVGGIGYRPGRATIVASGPNWFPIAHELGHNMSLGHAGCAPDNDPAYPHPNGTIGAWGNDFRSGTLVQPTVRVDLMSYCPDIRWISDYYFDQALRYRLADEGPPSAANVAAASLLLWGGVDTEGRPYLEPAFVVDAPPALPDSAGDYVVVGRRAEGGTELFSLSFTMPELGDAEGGSSFVFALPARPEWEDNLASITLTGPGGSVTLDRESDQPMAILRDPRTGQVLGFLRDPPPAQAAMDAAGQVGGPGLEVLFSRGIPGAAAWRR